MQNDKQKQNEWSSSRPAERIIAQPKHRSPFTEDDDVQTKQCSKSGFLRLLMLLTLKTTPEMVVPVFQCDGIFAPFASNNALRFTKLKSKPPSDVIMIGKWSSSQQGLACCKATRKERVIQQLKRET
eukprot:364787-Chlamydomonas_euryale.AAC.10